MTPERWQQVKEVLGNALDLDPDQRAAYLDTACDGDTALRAEVERLLAAEQRAGENFLDVTVTSCEQPSSTAPILDTRIGHRVGPYRIVERIGEGGMGTVYRAVRADDQYQKQVAIKLIQAGRDLAFIVSRFKNERQILASLDHPNIARLLDGGTTDDGAPYFVMELIEGQAIDEYCDQHRLPIGERLRIFLQVCAAVQFAHQRLIIHRDIKPGNILVGTDGIPKLLDFGIAKLLDPAGSREDATMTVFRALTPAYASPEQIQGAPITTASDVYSLGVVLYELLTGHSPYRVASRTLHELSQAVLEMEPERPSTAVTRAVTLGSGANRTQVTPAQITPDSASAVREESPEKLCRSLRGDLDNIVLMTLRKEPERRYPSVEQLAEDIRRYLRHLPVSASRGTFSYRSGKFIRRHTAAVAAAVVALVSLAAGLVISIRETRVARTQSARAERRFNEVRSLANSLMFDIHDAIRDLPGSTQARQLLVTNALKYLDSLAQEARGDRSLQSELADAYERVGAVQGQPYTSSLGDTAGALQSYLKAQAIRRTLASEDVPDYRIKEAANDRTVAILQLQSSNAAAAVNAAQEAVSIMQSVLKNHPANREALAELAGDHLCLGNVLDQTGGSEAAAEESFRSALGIDEKLAAGSTDRERLRSVAMDEFHIGRHLRDAGYRTEALDAFNKALPIFERLADSPNNTQSQRDVAAVASNLGDTYQMNGDAAQALAIYQKGLAAIMAISAADPKNGDARSAIGEAHLNVGDSLVKLGKTAEAREHYVRAITIFEKGLAANPKQEEINWDLEVAYVWLASVTADGKTALENYKKALSISQKLAQVDTGNANWFEAEAQVYVKMGDFFVKNDRFENAEENYRQAVALAEPIVASQAGRQEGRYGLANAYFGLGEVSYRRALRSQPRDEQVANWKDAKSWYQRSIDAWQQIRYPAAVSPYGFSTRNPEDAKRGLVRSTAALAALHR